MTKRVTGVALGAGLVVAIIGLCVLAAFIWPTLPRDEPPGLGVALQPPTGDAHPALGRISEENAKRIAHGMSLADVERLLGPARDETAGSYLPLYPPGSGLVITRDGPLYSDRYWVSKEVAITIRVNNKTKSVRQVWYYKPWEA